MLHQTMEVLRPYEFAIRLVRVGIGEVCVEPDLKLTSSSVRNERKRVGCLSMALGVKRTASMINFKIPTLKFVK